MIPIRFHIVLLNNWTIGYDIFPVCFKVKRIPASLFFVTGNSNRYRSYTTYR